MLRRLTSAYTFTSRLRCVAPAFASGACRSSGTASASPTTTASEQFGSSHLPLLDQLVGYYVNVQSRKRYNQDCLRAEHQAIRWAFADIRKNSEALAHGLLQTSLRPGDRVLAIQPSNCETLVLQLACAKIGAMLVVVPHFEMSPDKLRYYLNQFQPTHLVGREWLVVPEKKGGQLLERKMHFWETMYNVIPELGQTYPGQKFQWSHSQEYPFLKKMILTDRKNQNLLTTTPLRRLLCWGPFSYYEQRLCRLNMLLHPDDPILCLQDASPAAEDKTHIVFSHRNCSNAGYIFAELMGLEAETRFAVMPNHHLNPIGSIIAPYASITSGAVLVHAHDNMFNDAHAVAAIEKMSAEEVKGILGRRADFELLLKNAPNVDSDRFENLRWVALFEDGLEETAPQALLERLCTTLKLDDVFVFRGPLESCLMLQQRSWKKGDLGLVPHSECKVVGDRGTTDAKVLSRNHRGNLKLKGPHVTPYHYTNAGFVSELVDDKGWVSTSREATLDDRGKLTIFEAPQQY